MMRHELSCGLFHFPFPSGSSKVMMKINMMTIAARSETLFMMMMSLSEEEGPDIIKCSQEALDKL